MQTESPLDATRFATGRHQAPVIAKHASREHDDVACVRHGNLDHGITKYRLNGLNMAVAHVPIFRQIHNEHATWRENLPGIVEK